MLNEVDLDPRKLIKNKSAMAKALSFGLIDGLGKIYFVRCFPDCLIWRTTKYVWWKIDYMEMVVHGSGEANCVLVEVWKSLFGYVRPCL